MDKLVYLYELDSVRNSKREIEIGQQALFEEIVVNGNQVVLTFNQLTDSEAFLSAVKNENTYDEIIELFKIGALRISRFNNIRTASQYIQNSIDKCMEDNSNAFLFSGLPVIHTEKKLLEIIKHALQYSDPAVLEEYLSKLEENDNQEDIKRIEYIVRFIKMILVLSTESIANNPAKMDNKKTLMEFLEKTHNAYLKYGFQATDEKTKEVENILPQAIEVLKELEAEFISSEGEQQALKLMNNRSNWFNKLIDMQDEPKAYMAEAVIDLCYNYTMEESIFEVSKHYLENDDKMFWEDFQNRLILYWNSYISGIHKFNIEDSKEVIESELQLPDWALAVRIVKSRKNNTEPKKSTLYEKDYIQEKRKWNRELYKSILKRCGVAIIYIGIFCIVQYVMGIVEDQFTTAIADLGIISSILDIVCFGILGTLVSNWFNLPDILDSIKNVAIGIHDFFKYKFIKRGIAYRNDKKGEI